MALHFSLDTARPPHRRLIAAGALMLMLLTIGLTLSRGGLLALGVALLVVLAGAREPLRALGWVVLTAVASAPALVFGLASHPLTSAGVDLSSREQAGAIFAGIVVASLIALGLRGRAVIAVEPRLRLVAARARHAGAVGMSALVMLVVTAVVAAILTHAVHNFTSPTAPSNVNPNRLLTTDSYRWLWWREAASAFSDRPLGGWGAGSFGAVHLIYRRNTLPVQQPHSVPLQFLGETGTVGALLGLGGSPCCWPRASEARADLSSEGPSAPCPGRCWRRAAPTPSTSSTTGTGTSRRSRFPR